MNLTNNNKTDKNFYIVHVKCIYELDGCPYDEKDFGIEETRATSEEEAENNVRWRYLKNKHIGGLVDHQPYSDKYSEQWIFKAEEFYTTVIDNRKEREELDYEF